MVGFLFLPTFFQVGKLALWTRITNTFRQDNARLQDLILPFVGGVPVVGICLDSTTATDDNEVVQFVAINVRKLNRRTRQILSQARYNLSKVIPFVATFVQPSPGTTLSVNGDHISVAVSVRSAKAY